MVQKNKLRKALNLASRAYDREVATAQIEGHACDAHAKAQGEQVLLNTFDTDPAELIDSTKSCLTAFRQKYKNPYLSNALEGAVTAGLQYLGLTL